MDASLNKPDRPRRPRTLRDGRLVLLKRPDAADNARPRKLFVTTAATSRLLRTGQLSRVCVAGRIYADLLRWWSDHLRAVFARDHLTRLEQEDADDLARCELIKRLAWAEVGRAIEAGDHEARIAAEAAYLRARRELQALRARYDAASPAPLDVGALLAEDSDAPA